MPRSAGEEVSKRLVQAQLVLDEADKLVASSVRRLASIEQRLGILVGSSAIAGSLSTATERNIWTTGALGAIVVSAVLGVIALAPWSFPEITWSQVRIDLWSLDEAAATVELADRRHDLAAEREKQIRRKAVLLTIGFSFLGAAVVLLFLSVVGVVVMLK